MNYYNINTALFNYVSLHASSTVAFHPTVETVGFPGLHFVNAAESEYSKENIKGFIHKVMQTNSGVMLARQIFCV